MRNASRWWQAFLAFYTTVTSGILLTGVVTAKQAGVLTLIAAGLQGATAAYQKGSSDQGVKTNA